MPSLQHCYASRWASSKRVSHLWRSRSPYFLSMQTRSNYENLSNSIFLITSSCEHKQIIYAATYVHSVFVDPSQPWSMKAPYEYFFLRGDARFGIRDKPQGPCGTMLLDGPRSGDTGALAGFGAEGHKGLPRLEIRRAPRPCLRPSCVDWDPANCMIRGVSISGSHSAGSLSLKAPIAPRVGFVSLVASFPSAKCNRILTRAHSNSGVMIIYMARTAARPQHHDGHAHGLHAHGNRPKLSVATRHAFACILPDHFSGIIRAGFAKRRCHEMPCS